MFVIYDVLIRLRIRVIMKSLYMQNIIKIVQANSKFLRKIAEKVKISKIGTASIKGVLTDMNVALNKEDDGVAIAAPQISVSLRIFIVSGKMFVKNDQSKDEAKSTLKSRVFINPVIKKKSKKKEEMEEGCLSVRWKYGKVMRSTKATVSAYDEDGIKFTYTGSGVLAQIFQHETDHLNGILFIDTAREIKEVPPQS